MHGWNLKSSKDLFGVGIKRYYLQRQRAAELELHDDALECPSLSRWLQCLHPLVVRPRIRALPVPQAVGRLKFRDAFDRKNRMYLIMSADKQMAKAQFVPPCQ